MKNKKIIYIISSIIIVFIIVLVFVLLNNKKNDLKNDNKNQDNSKTLVEALMKKNNEADYKKISNGEILNEDTCFRNYAFISDNKIYISTSNNMYCYGTFSGNGNVYVNIESDYMVIYNNADRVDRENNIYTFIFNANNYTDKSISMTIDKDYPFNASPEETPVEDDEDSSFSGFYILLIFLIVIILLSVISYFIYKRNNKKNNSI